MSHALDVVRQLSDDAVLKRAQDCVAGERQATAALLATLSELPVRRLFPGEGFSSLFDYCTHSLHLSERAACSRIAAARLARRFPIVLDLIADSRVSLTVVSLLAKRLNEANCLALLQEATHKTAAEVEVITAVIKPLAPERYKVQFTISGETRAKLRVVQDLLRHSVPNGDLASVFDRALSALLADLEKRKLALVPRPGRRRGPRRKARG